MKLLLAIAMIVPTGFLVAAAPGNPQTATSGGEQAEEQRICRRVPRPGSSTGHRRVCMTNAEWERQAEETRSQAAAMMSGSDSCALRSEGGSSIQPGATAGQQMGAMIARSNGC